MFTMIIWSLIALIITNLITWQIAWRLGVKNGAKWEKYRQEAKENMEQNIPYGDRFRVDLGLDPADWQPVVIHRRRKLNGQWTED